MMRRRTRPLIGLPLAGLAVFLWAVPVPAQDPAHKDVGVFSAESRPPKTARRLAVLVALDSYADTDGLFTLRFAEKDAKDIAAALLKGGWHAKLLLASLEKVFPRTKWQYQLRKDRSKQRDRAGPGYDRTIDVFGDPR